MVGWSVALGVRQCTGRKMEVLQMNGWIATWDVRSAGFGTYALVRQ